VIRESMMISHFFGYADTLIHLARP
jgi:hypothetical protein